MVVIRTDPGGALASASLFKGRLDDASEAPAVEEERAAKETPAYSRVFQNLGLDVYDVASYQKWFCISDRTRNSVLVVNEQLAIERVIGGIGSAPGRLFRPGYIDVSNDGIICVQDGGNGRVQSFNIDGTYLGGFPTTTYVGFAAGAGGEVYLGQPDKGHLVSVYSQSGRRLRSFGKLKTFSEVYGSRFGYKDQLYHKAINRVRLSVDKDGNLLVSFMLAPILQKYRPNGDLLFERRLEGPEIDRLTRMLLSDSAEAYLTMATDGFPERVIALEALALGSGEINVMLADGSVYVADYEGRRLAVLNPQFGRHFTPEMAGLSPNGEVVVVGLSPRDCYLLLEEKSRSLRSE